MAFVDGWLIDGTNYQYKIKKAIGEGGFGITYLAKRNDGLDVVVKTLNDTIGSDPKVVVSEMLLSNNFEDYFHKSKVSKFLCQSEAETLIVS